MPGSGSVQDAVLDIKFESRRSQSCLPLKVWLYNFGVISKVAMQKIVHADAMFTSVRTSIQVRATTCMRMGTASEEK